jgi:uncharacterized protein YhaN
VKISGLQIDEFGVWSGLSIDNFPDSSYVFFGANEAGKSTLLQFIRTMLYGFTDERSKRFVQHRDADTGVIRVGGRIGGSLSMLAKDQQYQVRRHVSLTDPTSVVGDVRITTRDGSRQGANRLTTLLAGIDETIFNNVFAVGLEEMQHLGTLNDTQASRFLYSLSTGTDRVSLVDVMRQLQATRARLIGGEEEESYLAELLRRREACKAKIHKLGMQGDHWAQLRSELERLNDEVGRLEVTREKLQNRTQLSELALRVQPCWERHRQLKIEVESLGLVKRVPEDALTRLATLDQEIAGVNGKLEQQEQHRNQLQRELARLGGVGTVTRNLARIEALLDQQSTITGLHEQVQQYAVQVEEAEFEIQAEQERLGILADGRGIVSRFDTATFAALREPARNMEQLRDLLELTKHETSTAKEESSRIALILAEALGKQPEWFEGRDEGDIIKALEQTGEIASALRRRTQLRKNVQTYRDRLDGLVERRKRLLLNQLLPWEVIKAIGVVFTLGAFLAMWAFFGEYWGLTQQMRTGLGVMGGIGVAFATLLKMSLQHASNDALDMCLRKTEDAERDLEVAQQDLQELERIIPSRRAGPVDLRDAEKQVVRLESLLPMEAQRRRAIDRTRLGEKQAIEIAEKMKFARQHWEQALEAQGLSRRLTPAQVRELADETGNLVHLHRRHEEASENRERTMRELESYRDRMRSAMADAGIGGKAGTALDELGHLQLHINQHQQQRKQRDATNEKIRRDQRDHQQTLARLHELQRRRQAILNSANAVDEDDLRQMMGQRHRYDSVVQQAKDAKHELRSLLHGDLGRELKLELYSNGLEPIQKRHRKGRTELSRIDERLKELFERRAKVAEQLRALNADRQLDVARMELGVIDAKLADGIEQWKIISAITALLRKVYKRYEKERQPETLQEASIHLSRMTCGKYTRIWTPLDEDRLVVEESDGQSWTIDQMSRGTREQLFLALRLALVSGYAKRGVRMPLVLDDVLVNFDEERTKAAAEVLSDFAQQGHQMLVFTCHQHVMNLFQELGATAQKLPNNKGASVIAPLMADESFEEKPAKKRKAGKRSKGSKSRESSGKRKRSKRKKLMIGFSDDAQALPVLPAPLELAGAVANSVALEPPVFESVDDWRFVPEEVPESILAQQPGDRDYVEQVFDGAVSGDAQADVIDSPLAAAIPGFNEERAAAAAFTDRPVIPDWDAPVVPTAVDGIDWYAGTAAPQAATAGGVPEFEPLLGDDWADEIADEAARFADEPVRSARREDEEPFQDDLLDELPDSPLLSEHGPASAMDHGIVPDWSIETRWDEPERPTPRLSPTKAREKLEPFDDFENGDVAWDCEVGTSPQRSLPKPLSEPQSKPSSKPLSGSFPAVRPPTEELRPKRNRCASSERSSLTEEDTVLDLDLSDEAADISESDFVRPDSLFTPSQSLESSESAKPTTASFERRAPSQPASKTGREQLDAVGLESDETASQTPLARSLVGRVAPTLGAAALASGAAQRSMKQLPLDERVAGDEGTGWEPGLESDSLIRPTATGMLYSVAPPPADWVSPSPEESEQVETARAKNVFSSTSGAILPIVLGGSAVELSQQADSDELVDEIKDDNMSIVDRFIPKKSAQDVMVDEASVDESPIAAELQDTTSEVNAVLEDDEYEYEEVDEEDGEVATVTGDVSDDDEYEYEYVDDEEEGEVATVTGDAAVEVEYEYVEVEVDEDGNEIEDVAVETDEEVDDDEYEYEYVDDEEEEDGEEVAVATTVTGDVEEDVEYEYEYVDDDEEEEDDEVSAAAEEDEYEYVEVDDDEEEEEEDELV